MTFPPPIKGLCRKHRYRGKNLALHPELYSRAIYLPSDLLEAEPFRKIFPSAPSLVFFFKKPFRLKCQNISYKRKRSDIIADWLEGNLTLLLNSALWGCNNLYRRGFPPWEKQYLRENIWYINKCNDKLNVRPSTASIGISSSIWEISSHLGDMLQHGYFFLNDLLLGQPQNLS